MKNYVITIKDNPKSVEAAKRCIASGKQFGIEIEMFDAITPADNIYKLFDHYELPIHNFTEKYSRIQNCMAAFMSHYKLWLLSKSTKQEIRIFEHDAIIVNDIPDFLMYNYVINLGKPSYGQYKIPPILGVNPLTSKQYLPGAHGYQVKPLGATKLISEAKYNAGPTDVFIHLGRFPFLQEYYPWPVEARDSFTTIQNTRGCEQKHNYNEEYQII